MNKHSLTRRRFLRASLTAAGAAMLAACGTKEVVKETVVVEKTAAPRVVKETVVIRETAVPEEEPSAVQEVRMTAPFWVGEGDVKYLNPFGRGRDSSHGLLWAPLVWYDAEGRVVPEKSLAPTWDVSDDGKVYTFHLRKDAKYSDGTPITAQDVAQCYYWGAMLEHPQAAQVGLWGNLGYLCYDLVGAADQRQEKAPFDEFGFYPFEGVKAVSDYDVQFTLTAPSVSFVERLTLGSAIFKPSDLLAAKGKSYGNLDYWFGRGASTGPYKAAEIVPGDRYVLVPNEHYFGPKPKLSKITVLALSSDFNSLLTAFVNKELDLLPLGFTGDSARQVLADPYARDCAVPEVTYSVNQLWFTANVPLDDRHVRRAIYQALDKDALLRLLNANAPEPLFTKIESHVGPANPQCREEVLPNIKPLRFDPAAAKEELKQSKYWPQVLDMEFHLLSWGPSDLPLIEAVQAMLQENLGLRKVTVHTEAIPNLMDPPFPLHMWTNGQGGGGQATDLIMWNMAQLIPDREWTPEDKRPFIAVAYEPELKELVRQTLYEPDPVKHCELLLKAAQMWVDVAFSFDFNVAKAFHLFQPWLKGNPRCLAQGKIMNIEDWWIAKH
jgi:ABC-type transport system substrate-binding protein